MGGAIRRTALEVVRGCATIISNKGGLPETTNQALILKNLNDDSIYKQIRYLIKNVKKRKQIQRDSLKCSYYFFKHKNY